MTETTVTEQAETLAREAQAARTSRSATAKANKIEKLLEQLESEFTSGSPNARQQHRATVYHVENALAIARLAAEGKGR